MVGKRRDQRITTSSATAFSESGDFFFGDIINICRNGFFVKTDTLLPVDTELTLRIKPAEDMKIMDIAGRVVWAKQASAASPPGMGIEFVRESPEVINKITHFVDAHRQKQPLSIEPADENS